MIITEMMKKYTITQITKIICCLSKSEISSRSWLTIIE